jgi:hypothetical protein
MSDYEACVNIIIRGDSEISVKTSRAKAFQALDFLTGRTKVIGEDAQSVTTQNVPLEIPSRDKMEEYIRAQPDYQYSIEGIAKRFFGRDINSSESDSAERVLNGIRSKVRRIRDSIGESESGEWKDTFDGRYKIFKFVKSVETSPTEKSLLSYGQDSGQDAPYKNE